MVDPPITAAHNHAMNESRDRATRLTQKQEAFCLAYIELSDATAAYRRAYPVSQSWKPEAVWVAASRLASNPKVRLRINDLRRQVAEGVITDARRTLAIASTIAEADIGDLYDDSNRLRPVKELPKHVRLAVASFKVLRSTTRIDGSETVTEQVIEVKLHPKLQATDQLNRFHGNYAKDNASKPAPAVGVSTPALDYEEIRRRANELRAKAGIPPAVH